MRNKRKGFTLTEIMVSVIIVGVIASFGIVQYTKAIEKNLERVAALNLEALYGAQQIYHAKTGEYFLGSGAAVLDAGLETNLSALGEFYFECNWSPAGVDPEPWLGCRATKTGSVYTLEVGTDEGCYPPCCQGTTCPSLPQCVTSGDCTP